MRRYCGGRDSKATLDAAEHWREKGLLTDGFIFNETSPWKMEYLLDQDKFFD